MKIPEDLKCIDMTSFEDFSDQWFYDAQIQGDFKEKIRDGIEAQLSDANGGADISLTDQQLQEILVNLQDAQQRNPDQIVTSSEFEDITDPGWLDTIIDTISNTASDIKDSIGNAIVDGVNNNDGLSGNAADAIKNRHDALDQASKGNVSPNALDI